MEKKKKEKQSILMSDSVFTVTAESRVWLIVCRYIYE